MTESSLSDDDVFDPITARLFKDLEGLEHLDHDRQMEAFEAAHARFQEAAGYPADLADYDPANFKHAVALFAMDRGNRWIAVLCDHGPALLVDDWCEYLFNDHNQAFAAGMLAGLTAGLAPDSKTTEAALGALRKWAGVEPNQPAR